MKDYVPVERRLAGLEFAFTGRLASMTQSEAERVVVAHGGRCVQLPGRRTRFLVVGGEGPPIGRDGNVSRKLSRARELEAEGLSIEILPETEFLRKLDLESRDERVRQLFTTAQITRLLGVPRDTVRRWVRLGILRPAVTVHRLAYFEFAQVASARALCALLQENVPLHRIRRSLEQLRDWMPDIENPLAQLSLLHHDRELLLRLESGDIADTSGQLYFPFDEFQPGDHSPSSSPRDAERSRRAEQILTPIGPAAAGQSDFERGLAREDVGDLDGAAAAYEEALTAGGAKPEVHFNLGNVRYEQGDRAAAAEQYRAALELDPEYVETWNNLGNTLSELGRTAEAVVAYREALRLAPEYADVHFNLAELLYESGDDAEARSHWRTYLRYDQHSEWAALARRRLEE